MLQEDDRSVELCGFCQVLVLGPTPALPHASASRGTVEAGSCAFSGVAGEGLPFVGKSPHCPDGRCCHVTTPFQPITVSRGRKDTSVTRGNA